ncbi:MAG: hypothetical protein IPM29_31405 [Planctomycetes bacterium]|nr:hypothetical protein [Planctomycetota bacterium]
MTLDRLRFLSLALLLLCAATPLAAHGGQYRGPVPYLPLVPGGPGAPAPPTPALPTTGGGAAPASALTSWSFWWEFNKDRYLRLGEVVRGAPQPVDDGDGTSAPVTGRGPTDAQVRDEVLPALKRLMDSTDNRDVATACAMAFAKIGREHPSFDVLDLIRGQLTRGNQEVRETAALALGVAGLPGAFEDLLALVADNRRGRVLADRGSVDSRTRAFAVYALGLLARRLGDPERAERALDVLEPLLADREQDDRDLRVALVHGIGLCVTEIDGARGLRLRWRAMRALEAYWDQDLGRGSELLQAHVPTVLARIVGRGDTPDHRRLLASWVDAIGPRQDRHISVVQSLVLALGEVALPRESNDAQAAVSAALEDYLHRGKDQQARFFCLVALGRIGGAQNRELLVKEHRRGGQGTDKPWAALGLGLLAWERRQAGEPVDALIGDALHSGLLRVDNEDYQGAAAIAVGLCGYAPAAEDLIRLLRRNQKREELAGYLALALAMLQSAEGKPVVRQTLRESVRRPRLIAQAAVALALYGEADAPDELLRVMNDGSSNLARLAAIANAYRYVGDATAVEPLLRQMFAPDTSTLTRAFMAAALGGVCDKDLLPWNEPIAANVNYLAEVPTLRNGLTGILDIL